MYLFLIGSCSLLLYLAFPLSLYFPPWLLPLYVYVYAACLLYPFRFRLVASRLHSFGIHRTCLCSIQVIYSTLFILAKRTGPSPQSLIFVSLPWIHKRYNLGVCLCLPSSTNPFFYTLWLFASFTTLNRNIPFPCFMYIVQMPSSCYSSTQDIVPGCNST